MKKLNMMYIFYMAIFLLAGFSSALQSTVVPLQATLAFAPLALTSDLPVDSPLTEPLNSEIELPGPLLLDMPDESWAGQATKIALGEKVSLDELGPMVVNKDGTVSRITNWDVKLPHEREAIAKKISKRNQERIRALHQDGIGVQIPL